MRDELPAHRDGPDHLRVRILRNAVVAVADRLAHRGHSDHRGPGVRGTASRRSVLELSGDEGADGPRALAPEDHHAAAVTDPDRGGHRILRGSAPQRARSGGRWPRGLPGPTGGGGRGGASYRPGRARPPRQAHVALSAAAPPSTDN